MAGPSRLSCRPAAASPLRGLEEFQRGPLLALAHNRVQVGLILEAFRIIL